VSKRILMLGLLALFAVSSTGCFPRIRNCIANRWAMHHNYGGGACCTPAFKVPAQAGYMGQPVHMGQPGCSSCGGGDGGYSAGPPIVYQGPAIQPGSGVPTIGAPMPLLGGSAIPGPMPAKN
jgi:hypothetical protein